MIHSNTGELNQLYSTFNRVWGSGGNASLTLRTVDGKVTALLEIQLWPPKDPRPGAQPEAGPEAAGIECQPLAQQRRRRHRGPGRQASDVARREAWRARRQEHPPTHQAHSPPPPPPPPPPTAPPRQLIMVVRNRNSRASFSQLDGTTHHGVDNGEETNRPPKPPFPEGPDGLEETEDQEPESDESDVQGDTTEEFQDMCQTWKQYKGEECPFNCSLCMNKMIYANIATIYSHCADLALG